MLREFLLGRGFHPHVAVEDYGTGRGRALVDGDDVAHV